MGAVANHMTILRSCGFSLEVLLSVVGVPALLLGGRHALAAGGTDDSFLALRLIVDRGRLIDYSMSQRQQGLEFSNSGMQDFYLALKRLDCSLEGVFGKTCRSHQDRYSIN